MIFTFGKYYGKDTSEVDSSYLLFVIESQWADWILINACKQELSDRLHLNWKLPTDEEIELKVINSQLRKQNEHLFKVISLSTICRGNQYTLQQYLDNPEYADTIISLIRESAC